MTKKLLAALVLLSGAFAFGQVGGYSPFGYKTWKSPVLIEADLPTSGNSPADARISEDTFDIWVWTGSAWQNDSSGGGGSGTVTSVSVVSANGLAGTVANATTTPAITLSTSITGILQGNGTAISAATTTGSGSVVLATSPTLVTPALGTPSALVGTNISGTAANLTAGNVTTNANLTGPITSTGNATAIASQTGTGSTFVVQTSPTLTTPVIGAATGTSLSVSGQLTSTVSTGTAPLVVSSTTQVANLNAATSGSAGSATTATTATNLSGGAIGSVPYQSAAATTLFLAGNTTTTPEFYTSTGSGSAATAPTLTSSTGSGSVVLATSPTLVTPALGTPSALVLTNATGTPSAAIGLANATGLPLTTGVSGVLPSANGGTGLTFIPSASYTMAAGGTNLPTSSATTLSSTYATWSLLWDTASAFSASAGTYTVGYAGKYIVNWALEYNTMAAGQTRIIIVQSGGTSRTVILAQNSPVSVATGNVTAGSASFYCAVNDVLTFQGFQTSGSTMALAPDGAGYSHFDITWVGN